MVGSGSDSDPKPSTSEPSPENKNPQGQAPIDYTADPGPDAEEPEAVYMIVLEFSEKAIRLAFIRKVYSILMCQLLVTVGFIATFLFVPPVQKFTAENPALLIVAIVLMIITFIALACCRDLRRRPPANFILLGLFTIMEGFLLGAMSSFFSRNEVMLAIGITALVAFSITIFSFQTKIDFTMCGGLLFVFIIILILFGILALCLGPWMSILYILYGALGALLFSAYLVYDTQLIMGGEHKYAVSPGEYIFAALNLYLDVIEIFEMILCIFWAGSSS